MSAGSVSIRANGISQGNFVARQPAGAVQNVGIRPEAPPELLVSVSMARALTEPLETTPMSRADWRKPGAYEELRSLDAPGFAREYLRRNSDFLQDRRKLERSARRGVLNQAEADPFARRWGVRFRKRRRDKQPQLGVLSGFAPSDLVGRDLV
jgi:hypothetical protein